MENTNHRSRIAAFFENKSVFITGSTGFIGKMIVLKLLRSCPSTCHIYVLIREKKQKTAKERLEDIFGTEPFLNLFREMPDTRERVTAVSGDIAVTDLGLTRRDLDHLCNEVFVVIHAAASIRFDEPITTAMETNVGGLMNLLQLAAKMRNLQSFVHVSTAFSNCNRAKIEEIIYPTSITPLNAMERLASMTEDQVLAFTKNELEGRPNTYAFTKALAEQLINSHRNNLPVCVVRPSVVSCAQREPCPGWVDSWNGATGFVGFYLHGLLRFIQLGPQFTNLDQIPVDHAVNLVVAAAWFTATARTGGVDSYFIYNCCSGGSNPLSLQEFSDKCLNAASETPFSNVFWFPGVRYVRNSWTYWYCELLFHRLPCEALDLVAKLFSRKQRMMQIYRKMSNLLDASRFFLTFDFEFSIENTKKLYAQMSPVDRQVFHFDVDSINWDQYCRVMVAGIKKYLLHESDAQIEKDRTRFKRLYVIHWMLNGFAAILLLAFLIVILQ